MGLSDGERVRYLYHDIMNITRHADDLGGSDYKKLTGLIGGLWHAFLGVESNSSFWLFGGGAENAVTPDSLNVWGVAVLDKVDGIFKYSPDLGYISIYKDPDFYDVFDGVLDVRGLLKKDLRQTYIIYALTEQMTYRIRRYDDELCAKLSGLSKLVSDIQGECFNLFMEDEDYAKAYALSAACRLIYDEKHYPYNRPKWDVATQWLVKQNMQHQLSAPMEGHMSLRDVAEIHYNLQKAKSAGALTPTMRIVAALRLSARRFHYEHMFKELQKMMTEVPELTQVDMDVVSAEYAECLKKYDEYNREECKRAESYESNALSVYGSVD